MCAREGGGGGKGGGGVQCLETLAYYASSPSGPEVIKLFFVLSSTEHEIFSANKYENANNSRHIHILK